MTISKRGRMITTGGGGVVIRQALTEFLKTDTEEGYLKIRGEGWNTFTNEKVDEESLQKDFGEKIKARLFRKYYERPVLGPLAFEPVVPADYYGGMEGDGGVILIKRPRRSQGSFGGGEDVVDKAVAVKNAIEIENQEMALLRPIALDFDEIREVYLDNPNVTHVEIEGCLCDKEKLIEWVLSKKAPAVDKPIQATPDKVASLEKSEKAVEIPTPPAPAAGPAVTSSIVQAPPEGKFPLISQPPALLPTPPPGGRISLGTSRALPSLLGLYPVCVAIPNPPQPLTPRYTVNPKAYDRAKLWRPQNEAQRSAFEQAKKDLCQVLVVGKGCRIRSVFSEFSRITQENLELEKIGVPDLKTLLVQMEDLIILKKDRNGETVYIFPNMKHKDFECYLHIAQLVAEQRDATKFIPDQNVLDHYDIRQLFERPLYQHPNYYNASSSSSYGLFGGNSNSSWRNPPTSPNFYPNYFWNQPGAPGARPQFPSYPQQYQQTAYEYENFLRQQQQQLATGHH